MIFPDPAIGITINVSQGLIQYVELDLASSFEFYIKGQTTPSLTNAIHLWIEEYRQKKQPQINLPLNLTNLTPFTKQTLHQLSTSIPFGKTTSYKQLAHSLKKPNAQRAVGNALKKNPFPLFIPCHRVISNNGQLGGFTPNPQIKKCLLNFEGGDVVSVGSAHTRQRR